MNRLGNGDGRRLLVAIAAAAIVVLSAPFVGQLRSWIRATFPGQFVLIVTLVGVVLLGGALLVALVRIRSHRARRYGAIVAAVLLAALYSWINTGENPESNAVERFHFVEYGLIAFLFYRAWRHLGDLSIVLLPAFAGLIVGAAEEWLQWFIPNRVGEMRDIFLNLAAIGCGLLFSAGLEPPERFVPVITRASRPRVLGLAAATVVALALFFHAVHLGYEIHDTEAGSFSSRYSGLQLPELQRRQAETWLASPPPRVLRRLSREDQYLSEGLAHVRWRNRKWGEGDLDSAWRENLILEKYFAPVLDTPTYEGQAGHRWPAEQRADAKQRQSAAPGSPYVSAAYPYRIYTWPKGPFWLAIGALVALLLWASSSSMPNAQSPMPKAQSPNPKPEA